MFRLFQKTGEIMLPSELNKYQEFGFKKITFRPVSRLKDVFFLFPSMKCVDPGYCNISHGFRGTEVENCTESSDGDDRVATSVVLLHTSCIFWLISC